MDQAGRSVEGGGRAGAMSSVEAPDPAERLRRPSWRDPRLILGVLIVLASVAGVVALVSSQDRTAPVYAADRSLAVGEALDLESLRVVDVRIEDLSAQYLSAEEELPAGMQLVSVVEEGELIPARAVAQSDPQGRQAVTLEVDHMLARGVSPGRHVEVWVASGPSPEGDGGAEAEQLVGLAEVSDIDETTSTFGAQNAVSLELLVDPEELAELLAARSSGAVLSVVPAGAPADAEETEE